VRRYFRGERRPDASDPLKPLKRAEGTGGVPRGNDSGGEGRSDSREPVQLLGGGAIRVDGAYRIW
jgi:hypothetical protein